MASGTKVTSQEQVISQEQTYGRSDHRVKILALQGEGQDLTEEEAASLEKFLDCLEKCKRKIDPSGLSMKMLKECFHQIGGATTSKSSLHWMNLGTMSSGKISTQNGSYHKTGSGYTLSDILEDEVDTKYFLSREQAEKIILNS